MNELYLLAAYVSHHRQHLEMPTGIVLQQTNLLTQEEAFEDIVSKYKDLRIENIYQVEFIGTNSIEVVGSSLSGRKSLEVDLESGKVSTMSLQIRGRKL